eukprot:6455082-Amphidinium_carterae.1
MVQPRRPLAARSNEACCAAVGQLLVNKLREAVLGTKPVVSIFDDVSLMDSLVSASHINKHGLGVKRPPGMRTRTRSVWKTSQARGFRRPITDYYEFFSTLGVGAYGSVYLAAPRMNRGGA